VATALRIILADRGVEAVLLNIFGGITRCDEVARGIMAALDEIEPDVPLVVRLVGTNEEEGRAILAGSRHHPEPASTLSEAARRVVAAAQGAGRS
jgi:succinyl-CoA synthetase beta subunit